MESIVSSDSESLARSLVLFPLVLKALLKHHLEFQSTGANIQLVSFCLPAVIWQLVMSYWKHGIRAYLKFSKKYETELFKIQAFKSLKFLIVRSCCTMWKSASKVQVLEYRGTFRLKTGFFIDFFCFVLLSSLLLWSVRLLHADACTQLSSLLPQVSVSARTWHRRRHWYLLDWPHVPIILIVKVCWVKD